MSKRNKHKGPKGPKSPPQSNVVPEEIVADVEKPACELKPDSDNKATSAVVISEVIADVAKSEVKAIDIAVQKESGDKTSDQVNVVDSAKASDDGSPLKPKRHRNKRNKNKNNQNVADDSKDDEELDVLDEEKAKAEKSSVVKQPTTLKEIQSEIKEQEPQKTGRNKKKNKGQQQNVPNTSESSCVPILSQSDPVIDESTVDDNKSKKTNKVDAQTQVKNGKRSDKDNKQECLKIEKEGNVEPNKAANLKENKDLKQGALNIDAEKCESKPERSKKDNKNKNHGPKELPKVEECTMVEAENKTNIDTKIKDEKNKEDSVLDKKTSDDRNTKPKEDNDKQNNKQQKKGKKGKGDSDAEQDVEKKNKKDMTEAGATSDNKQKEIEKSDETSLVKEIKEERTKEAEVGETKPVDTSELKKHDLNKSKKQKNKQNKNVPEVSETLPIVEPLIIEEIIESVPASIETVKEDKLSVKGQKKNRSKTPEVKKIREADKHQISAELVSDNKCDLKKDEKKNEPEVIQQQAGVSESTKIENNKLSVKNQKKRRSKTPEVQEIIVSDNQKEKTAPICAVKIEETIKSQSEVKPEDFDFSQSQGEGISETNTKGNKHPEIKSETEKQQTIIDSVCDVKNDAEKEVADNKSVLEIKNEPEIISSQPTLMYPIEIKSEQFIVKDKKKRRSKTPEVKADIKNTSIAPVSDVKIEEIKEFKTGAIPVADNKKESEVIPCHSIVTTENKKDQLSIKEQKKRRSKTPEIKVENQSAASIQVCEVKCKEIKEPNSDIDKKKEIETSEKKEETITDVNICQLPAKDSKKLSPKGKRKGRSKTPDVKQEIAAKAEESSITIQKKVELFSTEEVKPENIDVIIKQNVSSSPEIKVKDTSDIQIPVIAPILQLTEEISKPMDCIKPQSKKNKKGRSKTPEIKPNIPNVQTPVEEIPQSVVASIEDTLKKMIDECVSIPDIKEIQAKHDIMTIPEEKNEKESEEDFIKYQDKHKKSKNNNKKETKTHTDEEKPKEKKRDISQDIEKVVFSNPVPEDIIKTLLSDIPPEFLSVDIKDESKTKDLPKGDQDMKETCVLLTKEEKKSDDKTIVEETKLQQPVQELKGKSKKHDKKKTESAEKFPGIKEVVEKKDEQLIEPDVINIAQKIETEEDNKCASPVNDPKPNKRNKDKKQKNQSKSGEKSAEISEEKIIEQQKKDENVPKDPNVSCIIPEVKEQCQPQCEKKSCESCPKKKSKGKTIVQTLDKELLQATKDQEKQEVTPIENIIPELIHEPLDPSKKQEVSPTENFEFLKIPDDVKPSNSQSKDKKKRSSKSPSSQSKNLHGPSNNPAKSSKCDYKKEKNKGNEKGAPDIIQSKGAKSEKTEMGSFCIENIEDLEEEFVYKYSFRTVFIANACHICKVQLKTERINCRFCHLVSYCTEAHRDDDWASHQSLCYAICTLAHVKAQEHIYADAKCLNGQDYRLLRMQGIVSCEKILKRKLCPWEQEVLLYPRMCMEPTCREWKSDCLKDCEQCGQVSFCTAHPNHLHADHTTWCPSYHLYHRLVSHQLHQGRIEPTLPMKIFQQYFQIPDDTAILYNILYDGKQQVDECYHATLTQLSTAPLTALYSYQKTVLAGQGDQASPVHVKPSLCIHIIGAELQFEADTLNKWESFFLHLSPGLQDLKIVFIGPELNTSNLPVDLLSRIKMCQSCKEVNRTIKFEFHDSMLYHDFVESSKFSKPDLICAFNPGFHRVTGYAGLDTWPETIGAALRLRVPLCITAYTQHEMPRDLARVHTVCPNVQMKLGPIRNPYSSLRPDRNFISDDEMPLIFKNYQLAIVSL